MELKYLEIDGVLLPLSDQIFTDDKNDEAVAHVSEIMERLESAEEISCISLSTSGAF